MTNLEYIISQLSKISDGEISDINYIRKLCKAAGATIEFQQSLIEYWEAQHEQN